MTNHARGSSLVQARNNNHRHFHSNPLPRHAHPDSDGAGNHIRSPPEPNKLHNRQVVVVQTVSVVHIIDDQGAIIGYSTLLPDPVTQLADSPAALTAGLSALDIPVPSPTLPGDVLPSSEATAPAGSPLPSLLSSLLSSETLTSAPSSESSAFPTLSGGFNSTRPPTFFSNSTVLYSNSTRSSSSTHQSSTFDPSSITATVFVVPTDSAGGAGGNPNANGLPPPPPSPAPSDPAPPSSGGLTPAAQSAVIGGVVGSVAGIALIALFLMFLLKWKKGHRSGLLLLGDGDSAVGRGLGSSPGPKSGGGGGMAERSVPFAVPSALASLTGQKKALEAGPRQAPMEEKGFYRVSGRKLVSVLQSGGDGYSDPHASVMSGTSDYRQSVAFFGSGPLQRLQLGSPMRPESGVPIIRSGPNRTPQQAQTPFSDDPRPVTPPTINPLGRSLTSLAGSADSRNSNPRFTENM
ncbi:hypothetical protein QBC47DRAFT_12212 [Echria macrotheca]|uniref:Uncharacterized protein n=1 Tax=Echria macrotheca TaxID=438768 RepID=A0AAJ0F9W6_9PEZI|nr:hypothetical protein QBC47DRAFT_12212 [Echria macrotheca]